MINGKTVLAITLARGGSRGIIKKNIVPINDKPLLCYTTDEVIKSKYIDRYIVATDDNDIEQLCNVMSSIDNKIECFKRKDVSNTQTSAEGLLEVLNNIDTYDYVIEIMCTNPLKKIEDIDGVIKKLDQSKSESVVSVVRIWDNHPSRVKFIENDILKGFDTNENPDIPGQRRQDLEPPAYVRNGSIYAMTWKQITQNHQRLGNIVRPYIMPIDRTINIDEPRDLMLAKSIIENENK
jgi:CMP-N-acetylneuraminic acid synthetase|tara:strand:+ start:3429 stop:4139 length:711 start_codon:yes stop_codon:yes gene_type:complete